MFRGHREAQLPKRFARAQGFGEAFCALPRSNAERASDTAADDMPVSGARAQNGTQLAPVASDGDNPEPLQDPFS